MSYALRIKILASLFRTISIVQVAYLPHINPDEKRFSLATMCFRDQAQKTCEEKKERTGSDLQPLLVETDSNGQGRWVNTYSAVNNRPRTSIHLFIGQLVEQDFKFIE